MDREAIRRAVALVGSQTVLAQRTGLSQAAISKLIRGHTGQPSAETAIAIERATEGQVTRAELRPDLWPTAGKGAPV